MITPSKANAEILIIVPARGGSKRILNKNLRNMHGKPLISWTIDCALECEIEPRIVVSSDDSEILKIAESYSNRNVYPQKRPAMLANDEATTAEVIKHVLETERALGFEYETIILLQPTSPLRKAEDVSRAISLFFQCEKLNTVVSVSELEHPSAWIGCLDSEYIFRGYKQSNKRSQDFNKEYRLNGAIYIFPATYFWTCHDFITPQVYGSVMPRERSVDIDVEYDWIVAEALFEKNNIGIQK